MEDGWGHSWHDEGLCRLALGAGACVSGRGWAGHGVTGGNAWGKRLVGQEPGATYHRGFLCFPVCLCALFL